MLYQMTRFLLSCSMTIVYPDSIAIYPNLPPIVKLMKAQKPNDDSRALYYLSLELLPATPLNTDTTFY